MKALSPVTATSSLETLTNLRGCGGIFVGSRRFNEVTWNQRHPDEQRIHGTGILTYYLVDFSGNLNVGKYTLHGYYGNDYIDDWLSSEQKLLC